MSKKATYQILCTSQPIRGPSIRRDAKSDRILQKDQESFEFRWLKATEHGAVFFTTWLASNIIISICNCKMYSILLLPEDGRKYKEN